MFRYTVHTKRKIKKKKHKVYAFLVGIFVPSGAFIVGCVSIFNLTVFEVSDVVVKNETVVGALENQVRDTVLPLFGSTQFLVIPPNHLLLYPRSKIKEAIIEEFPRIGEVSLRARKDALTVTLTEREALLKWCITKDEGEDERCFNVDGEGFIFEEVNKETTLPVLGASFTPTVVGVRGRIKTIDVPLLIKIIKFLNEQEIPVLSVERVVEEGYENQVVIHVEENLRIYINLNRSLYETTRDIYIPLVSIFEYGKEDGMWNEIEYIDTRFGENVYFK